MKTAKTMPASAAANDPQTLVTDAIQQWTQAQVVPLDAWFAWVRAMTAWQQELWDEWVVRFAGGAPIDG